MNSNKPRKSKAARPVSAKTTNRPRAPRAKGVKGNAVSVNNRGAVRVPRTTMTNGGTVVTHTETYGVGVEGAANFELFSTWAVQPGLSSYSSGSPLGSWLPQIAGNFDNYEIHKLKFHFRTACSTLERGLLMFAYEPNPDGSAPASYQEVRNMHSVDGSVHANLSFDVTPKLKGRKLLTRKGAVFALPNYDMGKVYLATIGCVQDTILGFVDVEYVIRLTNPQSSSTTTSYITPSYPDPEQQYVWNAGGITGSDDVWTAGAAPFSRAVVAATSAGAPLSTPLSGTYSLATATEMAQRFSQSSGTLSGLSITSAGRYSVTVQFAAATQTHREIALAPYLYRAGTMIRAVTAVQSGVNNATYVSLPCKAVCKYSQSAITTSPASFDRFMTATWEIQANAGDVLFVFFGSAGAQPDDATSITVTYTTDLGQGWLRLKYLGAAVTLS